MRLQGKVALITGGNSGIGLATARLFAAEGAKVAVTGRNPKTLAETMLTLPGALAIQADVDDPAALERAAAEAAQAFGKLDIVFANAGIAGGSPLGQTSLEQFERIVRTNLTSVFFTVQAALPHLNEGASIILNGSVHAVMGVPGFSAYAATKAAVRAMTRNIAAELAPRKIRVNQVTPGGTRTPLWSDQAPSDEAMDELDRRLGRAVALGRMGKADEIAKAALYLASDDSAYVTAAEIVVDGGLTGAPSGGPIYRG